MEFGNSTKPSKMPDIELQLYRDNKAYGAPVTIVGAEKLEGYSTLGKSTKIQ